MFCMFIIWLPAFVILMISCCVMLTLPVGIPTFIVTSGNSIHLASVIPSEAKNFMIAAHFDDPRSLRLKFSASGGGQGASIHRLSLPTLKILKYKRAQFIQRCKERLAIICFGELLNKPLQVRIRCNHE